VLRARPVEGKAISAFRVRGATARPPRAAGTVVALSRAAGGSLPGRGRRLPAPVVTRPALSPRSGSPRLPLGRCGSLLCAQSNASDSIAPCVRTLSGVFPYSKSRFTRSIHSKADCMSSSRFAAEKRCSRASVPSHLGCPACRPSTLVDPTLRQHRAPAKVSPCSALRTGAGRTGPHDGVGSQGK
jgi:hypothetical protein